MSSDGGVTGDSSDAAVVPMCDHSDDPAHFSVDVPTITLSGSITMNGAPIPADEPFGTITLRDVASGDAVTLGTAGNGAYAAKQIVPGTYDVYYSWNTNDSINPPILPRNGNARLEAGVALTTSQTFDVDIPTITLSGAITLNGAPAPTGEPYGTVYLRNPATGDSLILGRVGDPSYTSKQIVPGTYDVYYGWNTADSAGTPILPRNENVRLQTGVALTSTRTFNVNIPTVTLSGAITINGAPVGGEPYGTVYLRNTATADTIVLGQLGSAMYTTKQIVPGTYDIYYSWNSADSVVPARLPRNGNVRLRAGVALASSQTLNVDIPTITLSGAITMNGAPTSASEPYATVSLRDTTTGDTVVLGRLGDPSYAAKQIVPGTYDVYYSWMSSDSVVPPALPRNTNVRLQGGVALTGSQTFNVDIPSITLSGSITLNGAPAPASERYGTIQLVAPATGDRLVLGSLGDPSYTPKQIVPGTYDVYYSWMPTDPINPPGLPRNSNVRLQSAVALASTQSFTVDVPTITLAGAITINGTVPTDAFGSVWLVNRFTNDELQLGRTGDLTYTPKQIVAGIYDIVYRWNTADSSGSIPLPRNTNHVVGCTRLGVGP